MSESSGIEAVLAAHWGSTFDLGTPRQYTEHGGWNQNCECGHSLGDPGGEGGEDRVNARHRAHVAEQVTAWLAERMAAAELRNDVALAIEAADDQTLAAAWGVDPRADSIPIDYDNSADAALDAVTAHLCGEAS